MTAEQLSQLTVGVLVSLTPWFVVRIVLAVAVTHARHSGFTLVVPRHVAVLGWVTVLAVGVIAAAAAMLPGRSGWMIALDFAVIVLLSAIGLVALGRIHDASVPACEISSTSRVASLTPRRVSSYVPFAWRAALGIVGTLGLAALSWRLMVPVEGRRLVAPLTFAVAAPIFMWLYETWLRDLTVGVHPDGALPGEQARRRTMQLVFAAEVGLVVTCVSVAHALVDLNWSKQGTLAVVVSVAGASVAIAGCALAIASDVAKRRYRIA